MATNRWINPAYTAAAPYHVALLVGGFMLGRRMARAQAGQAFVAVILVAICLASWGVSQRMQGAARAHALFETPATLGAMLNLVLVPAAIALVYGRPRRTLAFALAVIFAGAVSTNSRGAWLALLGGGLVGVLLARRFALRPTKQGAQMLGLAAVIGVALAWLLPAVAAWLASIEWARETISAYRAPVSEHSMVGAEAVQSGAARLWLYDLAWRSITPSTLITGSGYLAFYYVLDAARADIPTFEGAITYFVHNDYLQTLFELGVPGLMGLLLLIALPLRALWTNPPPAALEDRVAAPALGGAIATMATHAWVDFPFYIPVCLVLFGLAIGSVDRLSPGRYERVPAGAVRKVIIAAVGTIAAWMLLAPVAAELAAGRASRMWAVGDAQRAAYWFETARRIEPRDWRYHWYAGQFWLGDAVQNRNAHAARFADRAFAEGMQANPREVRNVLGRLATHRVSRELLASPADATTMREWAERASRLAPNDATVRAERALVLRQFPADGAK